MCEQPITRCACTACGCKSERKSPIERCEKVLYIIGGFDDKCAKVSTSMTSHLDWLCTKCVSCRPRYSCEAKRREDLGRELRQSQKEFDQKKKQRLEEDLCADEDEERERKVGKERKTTPFK